MAVRGCRSGSCVGEDGFEGGFFVVGVHVVVCLVLRQVFLDLPYIGIALGLVIMDLEAKDIPVLNGMGDGVSGEPLLEAIFRGSHGGLRVLDFFEGEIRLEDGDGCVCPSVVELLLEGGELLIVIVGIVLVFDDLLQRGAVGDVPAVFVFEGEELGDEGVLEVTLSSNGKRFDASGWVWGEGSIGAGRLLRLPKCGVAEVSINGVVLVGTSGECQQRRVSGWHTSHRCAFLRPSYGTR